MTAIKPVASAGLDAPRSRHIGELARWTLIAVSFFVALRPLSDNSFLTHLSTGRVMLDGPTIVRSDVFTSTSGGEPWIAQSWLASLLYAGAESLGGLVAVRLLVALVAATLTWLLWALCRSAPTLLSRLLAVVLVVVGGMTQWGERPLMFGLVALAATLLILRDELDPRLLVPVMWLWAQTHGSFPLGVVVVVIAAAGGGLGTPHPKLLAPTAHARRSVVWVGLGAVLGGVVNPYGPKLLLFPFQLLGDNEALRDIHEWQRPDLLSASSLVVLFAALLVLVKAAGSRNARDVALVVVLGAMWWSAQRNLAPFVVVLTPLLAAALPPVGALSGAESVTNPRRYLRGLTVVTAVLTIAHLSVPSFDDRVYPAALVDQLEADDLLAGDLVHREFVGNYLEYRFEGSVPVFFDDRYELHATELILDHRTLVHATDGWAEVLERWDPDVVIWRLSDPLAPLLDADSAWIQTHVAGDWAAYQPS